MATPRHFIRKWRQHRGLSQEAVAEAIGIERSYLSRIETGSRRYDETILQDLSVVLKCSVVDLIARDPDDPQGLWAIYDQLTASARRQLADIGRTFIPSPPIAHGQVAEPGADFEHERNPRRRKSA